MKATWEAEGVRLFNADCREVLPTLDGIGAIIADPPYGIAHRRGACGDRGKGITLGASDIVGDCQPFDPAPWLALDVPCVLWGANWFSSRLPAGRWLLWDKQEHGGSGDFSEAEIAWCNRGKAIKFFRHMWLGVQRASEVSEPRLHPTQKPVALLRWCIEQTGVEPGALICDPYFGSGTTAIACIRMGYPFVGCEIDPTHFATAVKRITAELNRAPLFQESPPTQQPLFREPA